jgi:hypothetical protein
MERLFENLYVIMENDGIRTKPIMIVQFTGEVSCTVDDLSRERPTSEFWGEGVPDAWLVSSHVENDRWDD